MHSSLHKSVVQSASMCHSEDAGASDASVQLPADSPNDRKQFTERVAMLRGGGVFAHDAPGDSINQWQKIVTSGTSGRPAAAGSGVLAYDAPGDSAAGKE